MNNLHLNQFIKTLTNLDQLMVKAAAHADSRKFDVNNFLSERLAPDMLPFLKQVQIACDNAKLAAAKLSNNTAPSFEDTEKTWSELRERIKKTNEYLKTLQEADFSKYKEAKVAPAWAGGMWLTGEESFYELTIPNFYFHVTTAYNILRKAGVEIGKGDYIGHLDFKKS